MHNNIMAAGLRDRPPMLATGRYPQWRSRFLQYIDTRPNCEALRKCILSGPYKPTTILVQAVDVTDDYPAIPEHTTIETPMNMSLKNKAHFEAEKEAFHLILTGIRDEIYSTVNACQIAQEMWEAIKRSHSTTRYKGKETAKPITPPSKTASEEDIDPEQAKRDKDMQKNLALIAKYFKKIYKPTNNNLRTSLNSRNKNVDTTPRYKNEDHPGQSGNQRTVNVAGAREKTRMKKLMSRKWKHITATWLRFRRFLQLTQASILSQWNSNTCLVETDDSNVIPDSPDMCEDDIQNEQKDVESDDERVALADLIANLKLDVDENKKIQKQLKKANTTLAQELKECKAILAETNQFRAPTAQDMEILIQTCLMLLTIKTQNDSFIFVHELKQEMHANLKYVESLEKEIDELESDKAEFSNMYDMILNECVKECDCLAQKLSNQTESVSKKVHTELLQRFAKLEKHSISLEIALQKRKEQVKNDTVWNEKASNVFQKEREQYLEIQDLKAQLQDKNIAISELKKLVEKGKGKFMDTKFDKPSVVRQPNAQRIPKPSVLGKPAPFSNSLKRIYFPKTKLVPKTNMSEGLSKPVTAQTLPQTARQAVSNTNVHKPGMYRIDDRPRYRRNQLKDKVLPNNSQVKVKKTQVEVHPRIPSVSNKMKSVTHMTGNLKLLCNFVEKFPGTVRFGNDQFAGILGYGDLVQGNVTINRVYYVEGLNHNLFSVGQFCDADLEVAFRKSTCFVRDLQGNYLLIGNHGSDLYTISLQDSTSSTPLCLMAKASLTQAWLWHRRLSHLNFDYINLISKKDIVIGLPKLKYVKDQLCSSCELSKAKKSSFKSKTIPSSKGRLNLLHMDLCGPMRVASINGKKYILALDYDNSDPVPQRQDVSSSTDANVPSKQELDLLFGPLYDEFCNAGSNPQDKQPTMNIQPTSAPSTPTYVHAEENNNDQAEEEHLQDDEFTNPFCAPAQEVDESSSHNIGNSNVPTFNQPQVSEYRWTKDHPLEQVHGNPSRPMQTRRQLTTDLEMCMYALTVSTAEPKNIKEAMADSAWIEAMQEELH
uniref:Retrovirus-related Pol polyprotein from transposon TNT 1-94 n=1 Tax=Tanacetum cinerariifolium TaxID=118510 RepID=A0A6L2KXN1_TANCI|nr:retrovirus-related Pol polyprotein from transposon TNT 1-94 [Tanacetum cinerariifolium]